MAADTGGRPYLSVIIPAYNERERIGRSLAKILDYMTQNSIRAEILVIDDGSTDDTAGAASRHLGHGRGRVLKNVENRGKGYSVRRGVLEARGRWVLMTDADLSTPIEEHARLAAAARDRDLDIVIASRGLAESKIEIRQKRLRETMGKTFNVLIRALTGLRFRDTQCGFKLMDRRRVLPIFERMVVDGFAFDVELLYVASRFGLGIAELPVIWRNSPESKVGIATAPPRMLLDVLRVMWRFRRGAYNPESPAEQAAASNGH